MITIKKAVVVAATAGCLAAAGAGTAAAEGANAEAAAIGSPGVLSGNVVQVPINIPINICGNSINVLALLNPNFGNVCVNASSGRGGRHFATGHAFGGAHGFSKGFQNYGKGYGKGFGNGYGRG